jgi:hypothetical protein
VKSCSALFQLFDIPFFHMVQVVRLTKFDYRLANKLDPDMQKLRCRTNYKALQFTKPIQDMGQELVDRMRAKSGKYIALHLRLTLHKALSEFSSAVLGSIE